jgi:hypothetical protein
VTAGRPTKYDPAYCEQVVEHMATGASLTSFAAEIDVARDTLSEWANVHPEFSAAVKRAKAKCAAWWEKRNRDGAENGVPPGSNTLIIFGLKNMAPDEWADKQQIDHRSGDGSMTPKEPTYRLVSKDAAGK